MKRFTFILVALVSLSFFWGCSNDSPVAAENKSEVNELALEGNELKSDNGERSSFYSIRPGKTLKVDRRYYSWDRKYYCVFQSDGNFVLYTSNNVWVAQTHTYDRNAKPDRCVFQKDGNLVLYKGERPVWNSQTWTIDPWCLAIFKLGSNPRNYSLSIVTTDCRIAWKSNKPSENRVVMPGYEFPDW